MNAKAEDLVGRKLRKALARPASGPAPADSKAPTQRQTEDDRQRIGFRSLTELRANLVGTQYLIKPILERDTLTILYGDSDTYKSFLAIDMGLTIAHGLAFGGLRVHQGPVFYVCGEGQGGIGRRVEAWHISRAIPSRDAPFFVSKRPGALLDEDSASAVAEEIQARLDEAGLGAPALVIIDTMSANFGDGDESKNADAARFMANLNLYLRGQFSCSVLVIHHVGHMEKERERGAYAIRANADARILARRLQTPFAVALVCQKMKDGPTFEPMAFQGRQVTLPGVMDSEGEQQTSLAFERIPYEEKRAKLSRQAALLLEIISQCLDHKGQEPTQDCAQAPTPPRSDQRVCTRDVLKDYVLDQGGISDSGNPDSEAKALKRGIKTLQDFGRLVVFRDWLWLQQEADPMGSTEEVQPGLVPIPPDRPDNP